MLYLWKVRPTGTCKREILAKRNFLHEKTENSSSQASSWHAVTHSKWDETVSCLCLLIFRKHLIICTKQNIFFPRESLFAQIEWSGNLHLMNKNNLVSHARVLVLIEKPKISFKNNKSPTHAIQWNLSSLEVNTYCKALGGSL